MKPGKFTHTIAVILSSITSLFAHGTASKAEPARSKFSKKSEKSGEERFFDTTSISFTPGQLAAQSKPVQRFPWKGQMVTTGFWMGEKPAPNNPVTNRVSCKEKDWTKNLGVRHDLSATNRSN